MKSFWLIFLLVIVSANASAQERMVVFCRGKIYDAVIEFPSCFDAREDGSVYPYSNGLFFRKDGELYRNIPLNGRFTAAGTLYFGGEDTAFEISSPTLTANSPLNSLHRGSGRIGVDIQDVFPECTISVKNGDAPVPFCRK